mmetsp:Transcript_12660/g.29923  ORF Transcript_12660/g.29923 Transcript_12660/m.29923 type:complete len:229 (-) Transcript_12660:1260-1946(-)
MQQAKCRRSRALQLGFQRCPQQLRPKTWHSSKSTTAIGLDLLWEMAAKTWISKLMTPAVLPRRWKSLETYTRPHSMFARRSFRRIIPRSLLLNSAWPSCSTVPGAPTSMPANLMRNALTLYVKRFWSFFKRRMNKARVKKIYRVLELELPKFSWLLLIPAPDTSAMTRLSLGSIIPSSSRASAMMKTEPQIITISSFLAARSSAFLTCVDTDVSSLPSLFNSSLQGFV